MSCRLLLLLLFALAALLLLLWPADDDAGYGPALDRADEAGAPGAPRLEGRVPDPPADGKAAAEPGGPEAASEPKRTWRGTVCDATGAPVANAWVSIEHAETRGSLPLRTDAEGGWSVDLPGPGPWRLAAGATGRGMARHPPRRADIGTLEVPDLVIREIGVLAGRVVFPDGKPLDALSLHAVRQGPPDEFADPDEPGLGRVSASTDGAGAFRIVGLRSGRYDLVPTNRWFSVDGATVPTGKTDIRLVIPRHRTRVEIVDARGVPVTGAGVSVGRLEDGTWRAWGAENAKTGSTALWLDPAWTWAVGAMAPGHGPAEVRVVVPDGVWDRTIRLALPSPRPATARLHVALQDAHGEPVATAWAHLALPESGLVVHRLRTEPGGEVSGEVGGGTWRLVVTPEGVDPFSPRRGFHRELRETVVLADDAERTVRLVSSPGGKLRVTVRLDEATEPPDGDLSVEARRHAHAGDEGEPVETFVSFPRVGSRQTTDPLEPGAWRLQARAGPLASEVVDVEVVGGVTADVELVLRRP